MFSYTNISPRLWRMACAVSVMVVLLLAGCGDHAPVPRPNTAELMPPDLKDLYLGIEKEEVDKRFTVQGTQLTDEGLETITSFMRDTLKIVLAFAYRDGRLSSATIWYDFSLVPHRVDEERRSFLWFVMDRNGMDYHRCSFDMPGVPFVPDIGLCWYHPGYQVVATFSKPSDYFPDTIPFKPYFQFAIFDSVTTPFDLWPNIVIPADEPEHRYFHEVDSLQGVHEGPRIEVY